MTKGKGVPKGSFVESTPGPVTCEHGNRICGLCAAKNKEWSEVGPELLEALKTLAAEEFRDDDDPILALARGKARLAISRASGEKND